MSGELKEGNYMPVQGLSGSSAFSKTSLNNQEGQLKSFQLGGCGVLELSCSFDLLLNHKESHKE